MISEIHSSETLSAADAGGCDQSLAPRDLVDQQQKARVDAFLSSSGTQVNMTNCYKHCQHFFNRCKDGMIHDNVLKVYWMMAGYLGPIDSVDEAYYKGNRLLRDMIQGGLLKPSDEDHEMIEVVANPIGLCRHESSPCDAESFGFVELLDMVRIGSVVLRDGMASKRNCAADENYLCRQVFQSQRGKYIGYFNPTPNSLKPLLENIENPSVLMLRGFDDHLFPMRDFTFRKFKTLTVLEISGSGILSTVLLLPTVSKLTQLRYLYLSDPLIDSLPEGLFSELLQLRWLILRGCSRLDFNLDIRHLQKLEVLDLSYTSSTRIPDMWTRNLTHMFLRDSALSSHQSVLATQYRYRIKVLDLSGNQNLEELYRYATDHLVVLDLSRTRTKYTEFLVNLIHLRNLILRECTSIEELPRMNTLTNLEVLDVSGCENIQKLPEDVGNLKNMKELNLAGCSRLENLGEGFFDQMSCLLKLDLSTTKLKRLPSFANLTSLRKLTLRGMELNSLEVETWTSLSNLVKLDLHGLKISTSEELKLDFLGSLLNLQTLNLSKTSVAKLPDISMLVSLKELLLADCPNLKAVPDLQPLTSLETLDVSLPDDPIVKGCQLEVEPGAQRVLPFSLRRLVLANRPGVQRLFPLSSLGNLEILDLCGTDEIDFIGVPSSKKSENLQGQRTISKAIEFHIVYDVKHTGFDQFIYEFERIDALILDIKRSSTSKTANTNNIRDNYFERQLKVLHADMKYIQENIDRLKGSRNCKSSEELLQELVDAATNLSAADFKNDSPNLKQLLRLVVRLKLLLAPMQSNDHEASEATKKKKQPLFTKIAQNVAEVGEELSIPEHHPQEINGLRLTYQSLSSIQKNCLLCFSAFPCNENVKEITGVFKKSLVIKKRILIYWWVCEGFFDPHCLKDNLALEEESSSKYCYPRNRGVRSNVANHNFQQVPIAREMKDLQTIEDNGKQILEVFIEKGFIEPVKKKRRKSGSFRMHHHVHSFVTTEAKIEGFFDFNREKNNCLYPYVTRSKKDYLPKTQNNVPASTELWANRKNCQREFESARNVLTLFNVNGSVIDIKPQWFSQMKQLSVLSLGSWGCSENAKNIEIMDQKLLEELKSMKQLRLISLQGMTTIMKLPDSICKLTNLIILDLRECSYLEELPAGIGSLRNLIHLDLTDCAVLNKMPKGISLLSNLEVLRGFKITHEQGATGDQNAPNHKTTQSRWEKTMKGCVSVIHGKDNEVCTLRDLSKLEKLYKLSLVVNIKEFPSHGDVEVLMGMKRLRKLKILWERSFYSDNASGRSSSTQQHFDSLGNDWDIEKLELWCIPYKTLPDWVHPRKLTKLEKLYIVGGDLVEFHSRHAEISWPYLKTLRLMYLQGVTMGLHSFKNMFQRLTYMEIKECFFCSNSIWGNEMRCIWARMAPSHVRLFRESPPIRVLSEE